MSFDFENLEHCLKADLDEKSHKFRGVIVSCSGHADSAVLLDIFCRKIKFRNLPIFAVLHFNFGLRDLDSDQDEELVRENAARYQIGFMGFRFDPFESRTSKNGVQEWARSERLQVYRELTQMGFVVALGHHLDDQAETTIFRLARGTGAKNARGMQRLSQGIWRPLLHLSKDQISEISTELCVAHRYDRSNDTIKFSRNQIRKQVMPVLKEMHPAAASNITEWANQTADLAEYVESSIRSSITRPNERSVLMPSKWYSSGSVRPSVSIIAIEVALNQLGISHNSYRSFYLEICDRIQHMIRSQTILRQRFDDLLEMWIEQDQVGLANISDDMKFLKLERFAQCRSEIMSERLEVIGQNAVIHENATTAGGKLIEIQANAVECRRIELQIS
jgi:tRNA(Ile)-lysidine synthetase-like protein